MSLRLAALLSGSGTTLQNILDRIDRRELDAEVCCVISSRRDAYGLERAKKSGVPTAVFVRKEYPDQASFSAPIWTEIRQHNAELIVLAGFMVQLDIPADFANRIMNVHPALIPAFCGKGMYGHHVHEAVMTYGAKISGATVHFVDAEYDHGPIILQESVPVLEGDTPDTLAERVQAKERELYPRAIQLFAEGRLRVEGRRVRIGGNTSVELESLDNLKLIQNNLRHMLCELDRDSPSLFRVAKEAHHALYRTMIEALRGSNNFTIAGIKHGCPTVTYRRGDGPWTKIDKGPAVTGCKVAWRYSEPLATSEPPVTKRSYRQGPLVDFWGALAMIQTEFFMGGCVDSQIITVSDEEMKSLDWLTREVRNEYEHFCPKAYAVCVRSLLEGTAICLRITEELLFKSGNVLITNSYTSLQSLVENVAQRIALLST